MYQGWLFTLLNTSVYLVRGGAVVTSDYRGPPDGVGFLNGGSDALCRHCPLALWLAYIGMNSG